MKTLSLIEMENVKGGSCGSSIASLALTYGGAFLIAGPVGAGLFLAAFAFASYNAVSACRGY